MSDRPYLSIGEVLGLLLEEFPDITISKIRFLESQGLIEPERTASGYRKFYDAEVDRLRFILREQRENYLPLKVIKDRLGDTPPTGTPRGIRNVVVSDVPPGTGAYESPTASDAAVAHENTPVDPSGEVTVDPSGEVETPAAATVHSEDDIVPAAVRRGHPSARQTASVIVADLVEEPAPAPVSEKLPVATVPTHTAPIPRPAIPPALQHGGFDDSTGALARMMATHLTRAELLEASGVDGATLDELESYGLVTPRVLGQQVVYEPQAAVLAEIAAGFAALGIEVRHLKAWRTAAEREAGLFEQRITPLLRQRNPQAREQSVDILDQLVRLGGRLRDVMVEQSLRQYIDPR